jgi:hypothetical protein
MTSPYAPDRKPPHRCAWCRSKIRPDTAIPITGGQWACKASCRALEEQRIQTGETHSSAQRRRKGMAQSTTRARS